MRPRMGRPRKSGNRDLPDGLYPPAGKGCWRMHHPITGRMKSLKTKDAAEARELYWAIRKHYAPKIEAKAQAFFSGPLLSELADDYRLNQLPKVVTKKRGKPLDEHTRHTYGNYLKNFAAAPAFGVPVARFSELEEGPRLVRTYLAEWINQPKTYNYRLACLSRLFSYAIDKGLIQRNPTDPIERRTSPDREVYMTDDHFIAISSKLAELYHEVYAVAFDWIYLMSGRPSNMLDVKESQIRETEIHYYADKNEQPVIVERDPELNRVIEWFREYKRTQGIASPYLIVHPADANRKIACKPITAERLYRYFKVAMEKAELSGYTLRDLRPKALTDEAEIAGSPTNKGAHRTERMRQHYVKKRLPVRVKNNLKQIRGK